MKQNSHKRNFKLEEFLFSLPFIYSRDYGGKRLLFITFFQNRPIYHFNSLLTGNSFSEKKAKKAIVFASVCHRFFSTLS